MAKIYISATREDLFAECEKVKAWLLMNGHEPVDSYSPDSDPVLESCLVDIEACQLYLLIQGHRYGYRPTNGNPDNLSITCLEYRHAGNCGIPRIVLQRTSIPDVQYSDIRNQEDLVAQNLFRTEITGEQGVRPGLFADESKLIVVLREGVTKELARLGLATASKVLRLAFHRASRDLLDWPTTLPGGAWLARPELAQLQTRIRESTDSVTLVLGEPGCGKSALLARLGLVMEAAGVVVLGIKADFLPQDTRTLQALTDHMDLPAPVIAAIQTLAQEGPVLVLLDQLDALAEMVVQHSARLRVLLNLIRDLEAIPNVHVVASCRAFEQRHDSSLRHLPAEPLTLALPGWDAVDGIFQARGVQAGGWNADMQETLRSPHALDTFLSLLRATDEPSLVHGFQGMLQVQWEKKVVCDVGGRRKAMMLDLARAMAEREVLWLPLARFEERLAVLRELVAEGLLRLDEGSGRIHFRHQTLYEFVRARSFLDEPGSLTETVLAGQGSVRIRPQLWHALVFLRRVAPDQYQEELLGLWSADLRRHLRMLLIEFLGMQTEPMAEEVRLAFQQFDDPWFQLRFLNAVAGSFGWFERLAPVHLPMLMTQSSQEAAAVLPILDHALVFATQSVLSMVDHHWLLHPEKDLLSWQILARGPLAPQDSAWVDRLEQIVARTELAAW